MSTSTTTGSPHRQVVRRAVVVVLVVTAIASYAAWRAQAAGDKATEAAHNAERAGDAIVSESIARQVAQCESANEFRRLFRGYLATQAEQVTADQAVALPGFDALDAASQEFVRALAALIEVGATNAAKVREEYVAKFPLTDCAKLRRDLASGVTIPSAGAGDPVTYANCDAARADGATPLRKGEPGYTEALDADGDGLACE